MGHCVMLMAVDSVPRLWGRKREEGARDKESYVNAWQEEP